MRTLTNKTVAPISRETRKNSGGLYEDIFTLDISIWKLVGTWLVLVTVLVIIF
jgi:hypothetical protein